MSLTIGGTGYKIYQPLNQYQQEILSPLGMSCAMVNISVLSTSCCSV